MKQTKSKVSTSKKARKPQYRDLKANETVQRGDQFHLASTGTWFPARNSIGKLADLTLNNGRAVLGWRRPVTTKVIYRSLKGHEIVRRTDQMKRFGSTEWERTSPASVGFHACMLDYPRRRKFTRTVDAVVS